MTTHHLNGTERDNHETSYVEGVRAVNHSTANQVEHGRLYRENIVQHYPEMREVFAALPDLN